MTPPLVSVTIVTYNHEAFIASCLESVVAQQTSFPFEVIVGEDCSTDGTASIVRGFAVRYPEIIRPIFHAKNVGVNANWNDVLNCARGTYIAHLDGDDCMLPGKLQRQVEFLEAHPEAAACFHNVRVIDEAGNPLYTFTPPGTATAMRLDDVVGIGTPYCHSSKMVRRSAMPAMLDPNTRHIMDWLVHIENARHGQLAYIDEILGEYRRHARATTMGDARRAEALLEEQLYTISRAREYGASPEATLRAEARVYYSVALRFLHEGDYARFRHFIVKSRLHGHTTRAQAVSYRLRHHPGLVRLLARMYDRAVSRRAHRLDQTAGRPGA